MLLRRVGLDIGRCRSTDLATEAAHCSTRATHPCLPYTPGAPIQTVALPIRALKSRPFEAPHRRLGRHIGVTWTCPLRERTRLTLARARLPCSKAGLVMKPRLPTIEAPAKIGPLPETTLPVGV